MRKFPEATRVHLYQVVGKEGYCKRLSYSEAKHDPLAFRALIGTRLYWFTEQTAEDFCYEDKADNAALPDPRKAAAGPK